MWLNAADWSSGGAEVIRKYRGKCVMGDQKINGSGDVLTIIVVEEKKKKPPQCSDIKAVDRTVFIAS